MPKLIPFTKRHRSDRQLSLYGGLVANIQQYQTPRHLESCSSDLTATSRIISDDDIQASTFVTSQPLSDEESRERKRRMMYLESDDDSLAAEADVREFPSSLGYSNSRALTKSVTLPLLSRSTSRLKRPAPSECLVSLASDGDSCNNEDEKFALTTPRRRSLSLAIDNDCYTTSQCHPMSPWGHFVDILIPEDESEEPRGSKVPSFLPGCVCPSPPQTLSFSNDCSKVPLTARFNMRSGHPRKGISMPMRKPLKLYGGHETQDHVDHGAFRRFILTTPEIDDTAQRFNSLSF